MIFDAQWLAEHHTQPFTDAWVDWFAERFGPESCHATAW